MVYSNDTKASKDMIYQNLKYDVAVVGGGPAGAVAAIAAARRGAKTLLVERYGYLGGMLTAAGVGPQMTFHAGEKQVVLGIAQEMAQEMVKRGFSTGHVKDGVGFCDTTTAFDPEGMKVVWEDMVMESGAQLLYHAVFTGCTVENGKIKSAQIYTKGGFYDLYAAVFIPILLFSLRLVCYKRLLESFCIKFFYKVFFDFLV